MEDDIVVLYIELKFAVNKHGRDFKVRGVFDGG
jgi:hypothetical protein